MMKDFWKHHEEDKAASVEFGDYPVEEQVLVDKPMALPGDEVMFFNPRAPKQGYVVGKVVFVTTQWLSIEHRFNLYTCEVYGKKYLVTVREAEKI